MSYILDTHTLLWFIENDDKLSPSAKSILENTDESLSISIASLWEIAIKINIGKLTISSSLETLINYLEDQGISILPISHSDLTEYINLPLHHRDPFDRLIIIQALQNNLTALGGDKIFDLYEVKRIW